jgi:hypothetical protein
VEAEAQAVCQGNARAGRRRQARTGLLTASSKLPSLPCSPLDDAADEHGRADDRRYGA